MIVTQRSEFYLKSVILLSLYHIFLANKNDIRKYDMFYDVYLSSDNILATISGVSKMECGVQCQINPYCVSFNVRQNGQCQILGQWKNQTNIVTEQGSVFTGL